MTRIYLLLPLALAVLLLVVGCGGGGKSPVVTPPQPPQPPSNGQPSEEITVRILSPAEVQAGENVTLELTTGNHHDQALEFAEVNWNWVPNNPELTFKKLQNSRYWRVTFPTVTSRIVYTLSFIATNAELNLRFTGSTQIVVHPRPTITPPRVVITYPWEQVPETRVVSTGVKL
ncbi:MAG: hypothetical protein ACK4I8_08880, partial [Armatimonadota bacterium]